MHICVYVYGKYKNPKLDRDDILIYIYIYIRVRLRMIFKYTEIVCRKTHDVSANAYMDSKPKARNPYARMRMCIRKISNPKIDRECILIYVYMCDYA